MVLRLKNDRLRRRWKGRKILSLLYAPCALCALFCASCGIFSPRPVEYPTTTTVDDPFNFASILYNMGDKKFTKLDYNDLFTGDPEGLNIVYYDINGRQFTKKDLISNLTLTQNTLSIKTATWKPDPQSPDITISDTMIVVNRLYNVIAENSQSKLDTFTSKSSFTVVKSSTTNAWMISQWKDEYQGYSIFHPWFTTN